MSLVSNTKKKKKKEGTKVRRLYALNNFLRYISLDSFYFFSAHYYACRIHQYHAL